MDWSHVGDVFCEKRVASSLGCHVDCLELLIILVRDQQVVLGDGGNVVCLGDDLGLPVLRLVVTVGHERLKNIAFYH